MITARREAISGVTAHETAHAGGRGRSESMAWADPVKWELLIEPSSRLANSYEPYAVDVAPGRDDSDEAYVIDLCDEILGELATRQHRFDWLLGDPGRYGSQRRLPVDAYYSQLGMVVEYQERQHDEAIDHFDKPNVITVSGVHRGIQRRIYDARRAKVIPEHDLRYVVVRPDDLAAGRRGHLLRDRASDVESLRRLLLS